MPNTIGHGGVHSEFYRVSSHCVVGNVHKLSVFYLGGGGKKKKQAIFLIKQKSQKNEYLFNCVLYLLPE